MSKELIDRAYGSESFLSSRWITQSALAVIMIWLVLKKEVRQLTYASLVLFFAILIFMFLLFLHYLTSDPSPDQKEDLLNTTFDLKFLASYPTIPSIYSLNPSFFTVFGSLRNKSKKNGLITGTIAAISLFLIYITVPLLAFGLYGHDVKKNLLVNISKESGVLPTILQFLFLAIAIVHIPVVFFIGKEAVLIIFDEITRRSYSRPPRKVLVDTHENEKNTEKHQSSEHDHRIENQNSDAENHIDEDRNDNAQPADGEKMSNQENEDQPQTHMPYVETEHHGHDQSNEVMIKGGKVGIQASESMEHHDETQDQKKLMNSNWTPNPKEYLNMKSLNYYLVVTITFIIVTLLSIVVGDVTIFFSFIGANTACYVQFVAPGSFYVISFHKTGQKFTTKRSYVAYIIAWLYFIVGVFFMIFFNIIIILQLAS